MLIVFEGPEGTGKTTQLTGLLKTLRDLGIEVTLAKEPGTTDLGQAVRAILLSSGHISKTNLTEVLLFYAARAQLLHEVILPALEEGKVVI